MSISPFYRDKSFFQDLRDRQELINASDFDRQFNNLTDYINKHVIYAINNTVLGGVIPGSTDEDTVNKFLRNIGDGNVEWSNIDSSIIPDFALEFQKIAKTLASCAILASGADQTFTEISTVNGNEVLMSRIGDTPIWRKVQTTDIDDRAITGNKIGLRAINNTHLQPGVLVNNLVNGQIINDNFVDQSVTVTKLANGIFSGQGRILGQLPLDGVNNQVIYNALRAENIKRGSLTVDLIDPQALIPNIFPNGAWLTTNKIKPNSLDDDCIYMNGVFVLPSEKLAPFFQLDSSKLSLGWAYKYNFNDEVKAAFTRLGL